MRMTYYSVSDEGILGEKNRVLLSGVEPKKMFVCQQKQKQKKERKQLSSCSYHPSALKLSISASGQRKSRSE